MNYVFLFLNFLFFGYSSIFIVINFSFHNLKKELITSLFLSLTLIASNTFALGILGFLTSFHVFLSSFLLFIFCLFFNKIKKGENSPFSWLKKLFHSGYVLFQEIKSDGLAVTLTILFCFLLCLIIYLDYLFPPYAFDDLWYHLVNITTWIQSGKISIPNFSIWTKTYPFNAELVYTVVPLFLKNDTWIETAQFPFVFLSIFIIYSFARTFHISRKYSYASAISFFFIPIVFAQCSSAYTDITFASLFLTLIYFTFEYYKKTDWVHLLLISICSGFFLGVKFSSFLYIFVLFLFCILVPNIFKVKKNIFTFKKLILHTLVFISITVIGGGFWYFRTWFYFKNPVFPFLIKFHNIIIFNGWKTVDDFIMKPNTPPELVHHYSFVRFFYSWFLIKPGESYIYDARSGGFGWLWIFVFLPCILFSIYFLIKKYKVQSYFIFVPIVITFFVQPANWWVRYTISFLVLGLISFGFFMDKISFYKSHLLKGFMKVIMIGVIIFQSGQIFNYNTISKFFLLPKEQRTINNYITSPVYNWVYKIKEPANIGYVSIAIAPSLPSYVNIESIYPYFGNHFQNHLFKLETNSENVFYQLIKKNNIDYIIIPDKTIYENWVGNKSDLFKKVDLFYDTRDLHNHVVYKINKTVY